MISEILNIPDGIPQDLLDKAEYVVIFSSVKKVAIGIGGSYGRGALICRSGAKYNGPMGPARNVCVGGGEYWLPVRSASYGFCFVGHEQQRSQVHSEQQSEIGSGRFAAAGSKGRYASAATDIVMKAEILSYSRSRGLFAGISLEGSTLRSDGGANKNLYRKELEAEDIILKGAVKTPAAGESLVTLLNKKSPQNRGAD